MNTGQLEDLKILARQALFERGFDPDFSDEVQHELNSIHHAPSYNSE